MKLKLSTIAGYACLFLGSLLIFSPLGILMLKTSEVKPLEVIWVNTPKPNELTYTEFKLPTTNGWIELGMRSDGVVVWRNFKGKL